MLCPVVAFHTAFNDHHSLGYGTFIFSIADEKKEHKSLSTLDKEPRFFVPYICLLKAHQPGGEEKEEEKKSVTFAQLSLS